MCQNIINCLLLSQLTTFSLLFTICHIRIVAKLWHKRLLSYIFSILASLNIGIPFRVCVYIYIYIYRERERERLFWVFWAYKIITTKLGQKTHSFISPRISFSTHFIPMWAKPNVNLLLHWNFFQDIVASEWIFLLWPFPAEGKLIRWVLFMYLFFAWITSWVVWTYSLVYIYIYIFLPIKKKHF